MPQVLAPFLLPGSDDPVDLNNKCRLPPSQGNFWQTPLFTNAEAMVAYWRVRKWRVDVTVSGYVVGAIGCDVEMNAADESELVCGKDASGSASVEMLIPSGEFNTDVNLSVGVGAGGIGVQVDFLDVPEGGDSNIIWNTTDSSGSNQITLTMGSITKNLSGAYIVMPITATGTMNAVEWWSYGGLYDTSTGEPL
jgi:hypothetical protein